MTLTDSTIADYCNDVWDGITVVHHEYIAIPNVSPAFDRPCESEVTWEPPSR